MSAEFFVLGFLSFTCGFLFCLWTVNKDMDELNAIYERTIASLEKTKAGYEEMKTGYEKMRDGYQQKLRKEDR